MSLYRTSGSGKDLVYVRIKEVHVRKTKLMRSVEDKYRQPLETLLPRLYNEKGVDVNLASDVVDFRTKYDHLILFSGDADYIPAIQKYKDSARHVTAVTFATKDGNLLPGGARRLRLKVDKTIELSYTKLAEFLHLGNEKVEDPEPVQVSE